MPSTPSKYTRLHNTKVRISSYLCDLAARAILEFRKDLLERSCGLAGDLVNDHLFCIKCTS
jgi:hypothetical protein